MRHGYLLATSTLVPLAVLLLSLLLIVLAVMHVPSLHNAFVPLLTALGICSLSSLSLVSALGTSCSAPVTSGTAAPTAPFWMEQIQHQGIAPFHPASSSYQVFRNVKVRPFLSRVLVLGGSLPISGFRGRG